MLLESVKNILQQYQNDCFVACCQQVLGNLGIEQSHQWLWRQLETSSGDATSFTNVTNLEKSLGLVVELQRFNDDIEQFAPYIESGLPILVAVNSDDPGLWPFYRDHAVVVIGFDDEYVYVNDPAQSKTGLRVGRGTFQWAWSERDYVYAVIRLA